MASRSTRVQQSAAARSSDIGVRCAALVSLAELGDERANDLARKAIAESDVRLREASGEVFILLASPERFKATSALVSDEATVAIGLRMAERVHNPEITKLVTARAFDEFARSLVHREEIRAVAFQRRHAETAGATRDVLRSDGISRAGVLAVAVVLEDEDRRHLQDYGHVHRLEHGALVRAAVATEGHAHAAVAPVAAGDRRADRDRRAPAYDRICTQHAALGVGDVHRAALAAAQAVTATVDLEHHPGYVATFRDAVPVSAMRAHDVVAVVEMRADADGDRLLSRVQMREARDLAGCDLDVQTLLELADGLHPPVDLDQSVRLKSPRHAITH